MESEKEHYAFCPKASINVAIGICARNEQFTITDCLESVICSAKKCGEMYTWKVYVCINGSTDDTSSIVRSWCNRQSEYQIEIIEREEANLVEAQRAIVDASRKEGLNLHFFVDADATLDIECLSRLINSLKENPAAEVVYAVSITRERKNKNILERALTQYDQMPTVFSPRKHLHGRAFIIRNWDIPKTDPPLIIDDVYLSFCILHKHGHRAIVACEDAVVFHWQVNTVRDYYRTLRRRNVEVTKVLTLFPDFQGLPADQVNRVLYIKELAHEPPARQVLWLYFLTLKKVCALYLRLELYLRPVTRDQWAESHSSKRGMEKPILVLLEGLDCSGKKTVARELRKKLVHGGVSVTINSGPLGHGAYKYISSFVSLHAVPNWLRSLVYAFDGSGDRRGVCQYRSDVVLQISSPMRGWAYATINKVHWRMCLARAMRKVLPKYDIVCYTTAPYHVRLDRHKNQVAAGENPDTISRRFTGKERFEDMESVLLHIIKKRSRLDYKHNTSKGTKEILAHLYADVMEKINQRAEGNW